MISFWWMKGPAPVPFHFIQCVVIQIQSVVQRPVGQINYFYCSINQSITQMLVSYHVAVLYDDCLWFHLALLHVASFSLYKQQGVAEWINGR